MVQLVLDENLLKIVHSVSQHDPQFGQFGWVPTIVVRLGLTTVEVKLIGKGAQADRGKCQS